MLDLIVIVLSLALLVVGSATDIRWREVPDWVNFAGIAAGLGIRALAGALAWDWTPLVQGLFGFGAMFALAWALYYLGQWGGGDSKLLMALGALLGLEVSWGNLLLAFLILAMVVGAFYGLGWSIVLGLRHRRLVAPAWQKMMAATRRYRILAWILAGIIALAAIAVQDAFIAVLVLALAALFPLLLYAALFTKVIEQCCMLHRVPPDRLTEGDWIAADVVVSGRRIAGPKDLGVSKKQIALLRRLFAQKKVKTVLVKNGIPFVPCLLIAFVLTLMVGNVLRFLV